MARTGTQLTRNAVQIDVVRISARCLEIRHGAELLEVVETRVHAEVLLERLREQLAGGALEVTWR